MAFKDFSKKIVDNITKGLLQNYQNFTSQNQSSWVMGRLNGDGTATLPDGSTVKVITRGITGTYVRLFNMGNGTWLADVPSSRHIQADNSKQLPYALTFWTDYLGGPIADPNAFNILGYYAVLIDVTNDKVYAIPNSLTGVLDASYNTVFKFSDDGKHILITDPFQNPNRPYPKAIRIIQNWYLDNTSMQVATNDPVIVVPFNLDSYPTVPDPNPPLNLRSRFISIAASTRTGTSDIQLTVAVYQEAQAFVYRYLVYVIPDLINAPQTYQILEQGPSNTRLYNVEHLQVFPSGDFYCCLGLTTSVGDPEGVGRRALLFRNNQLIRTYPVGEVFTTVPTDFPWAYSQDVVYSSDDFAGITIPSEITPSFGRDAFAASFLTPYTFFRNGNNSSSGLQKIRAGYAGQTVSNLPTQGPLPIYPGNYYILKFKDNLGLLEGEIVYEFSMTTLYPGSLPIYGDPRFPLATPGVPCIIYR